MKTLRNLLTVFAAVVLFASTGCRSDHTSANPAFDQSEKNDTANKANPPLHQGPVNNEPINQSDRTQY